MSTVIKEIEFDNNYPKLFGQKYAKLLAVFVGISGERLFKKMPDLMYYDTIRNDGMRTYIEPDETYMILLFEGDLGILFSSIRKSNEENTEKYCDSIGEVFSIVIKGLQQKKRSQFDIEYDYVRALEKKVTNALFINEMSNQD